MVRKLTHIPEHISGVDFGDIIGKYFSFHTDEARINRNIKTEVLSQAQSRKYYRQLVAMVNQRIVLVEKLDKLRKEAEKIHNIISK